MTFKGLVTVLLFPILLLSLLSTCATAQEMPAAKAQSHPAPEQAATVLTLDSVIREALASNPSVQSTAHMIAAQRSKISQARALPDPTVSVGWMGNATPFSVQRGDPSSYRSITAMQMLPFPGKLKLKGEIANREMKAASADDEGVRRKITNQAKAAFFEYFYYDKALQVAMREKDLLQKLSSISEARYRVGKSMQQDVLKSQTEVSMLLQKTTVLQQQRAVAQAKLNVLMARSPESPLPPAAEVALSEPPRSLDELYRLVEKNSAMVQREQRMVERNQLAVNLAEKEYRPDLSVAFMYQQRPDMPDMKGATLTVNIPVFYKSKQREGVRQAQEELIAAQKSREDKINEARLELKQAYLAAKAAKDLADLYSKAVVPQASLALEASMSSYQVGSNDFLSVLSNFSTLLNYETDYYRQVSDYNMALADMENLAGVDLTTAQPEATPTVKLGAAVEMTARPNSSQSESPKSAAASALPDAQAVTK